MDEEKKAKNLEVNTKEKKDEKNDRKMSPIKREYSLKENKEIKESNEDDLNKAMIESNE